MRIRRGTILLLGVAAMAGALPFLHAQPEPRAPLYSYKIVHVYPHNPTAFTQGLEFRDGFLYEGTGLNGKSSIRKVDLDTGKVLQETALDAEYFGEGITVLGERLLELTWRSHKGFEYDRKTFAALRTFDYPGEGWGLTNDGSRIYMSDGSSQIRVWDPASLMELRRLDVHDGTRSVESLNELEYVRNEIYANVWLTDRIARIDPADGHVTGWIDLSGLLTQAEQEAGADVLNGIAYDAIRNRLFVTGKLWPKLFEIQLIRQS
jgi:glutamine cyclotransferase